MGKFLNAVVAGAVGYGLANHVHKCTAENETLKECITNFIVAHPEMETSEIINELQEIVNDYKNRF